ncbi:MAG TPA: hypothetical protein VGH77_27830 [Streptosporangiaceae bacterium]
MAAGLAGGPRGFAAARVYLLAVAGLTVIPARIGARRSVAEILQAETP